MDFPTEEQDQVRPPDELVDETAAAEEAARTADRLQIFGTTLAKRRDEWVAARASLGLDKQWAEDLDQFNGRDTPSKQNASMMQSVQRGFPVTQHQAVATRSSVFVQATRQKTNSGAARLGDILLPTDERNFSIGPTTLPRLPSSVHTAAPAPAAADMSTQASLQMPAQASAEGGPQPAAAPPKIPGAPAAPGGAPQQPLKPVDAAVQKLLDEHAEAKRRSDAMQDEIADCLEQCDHNAEVRKVVANAALFGAGVIEGPIVVNRVRKAWVRKTDAKGAAYWVMETAQELKPASFSLDPRFFYPDPSCGDNVQNGRGAFKLQRRTSKLVRDLAKQELYLKDQLRAVLDEGPQPSKRATVLLDVDELDPGHNDTYEHWVYWGEVEKDDLLAAGVQVDDDELTVVSACVEMINSTVVRAYLNPLADGALPFDVFPWEPRPGTIWGYGVPYLMRAQQRVINAGWRMILDNAGVSSGPQIVMKPGQIQPADQQWSLTSRKIWYASDDVDDVSKAFATFEFNTRQAELQSIIEMAEKLSDQETAIPMLAQGEKGNSPDTVGGMQLLMSSTNVMLRRLVKSFDDRITKPHIRRYYDYLMEYSDREEIKGDFQVVALGSSSLVVRDIQNQAITQMLALGGNPAFAPLINLKKLFEKALRAQHIDPVDVMNTDAEITAIMKRQAENAPKDPRVAAAEFRSQADKERTQAQVEMNRETLQTKQQTALEELQLRRELAQMQRETEMLKLAQQSNLSLEQIRASLASIGIKERSKQQMQAREMELSATTGSGI